MKKLGALVLSNGSIYKGRLFGDTSAEETLGEVVFQTGMVGYSESLTDPSYHKQILLLTYPLIGNYGVPNGDFESDRIWPAALVCCELSENYSHWNAQQSLDTWMHENKKPGLQGVDTRKLTKELRSIGTIVGKIIAIDEQQQENVDIMLAQKAKELFDKPEFKNYPQSLNLVEEVNSSFKEKVINNDVLGFFYQKPRILLVDNFFFKT